MGGVSIYHEYGDQNTMGRGSIYYGYGGQNTMERLSALDVLFLCLQGFV
jgi:hypothetical protein